MVAGGEWYFDEERGELHDKCVQGIYRGDDSVHPLFSISIRRCLRGLLGTQDGRCQQLAGHLVKILPEECFCESKPMLPLEVNGAHLIQLQLDAVGHESLVVFPVDAQHGVRSKGPQQNTT